MIATRVATRATATLVVALAACEGAAEDTGATAQRVEIEATSYAYSPATITVPAGRIRFVIHNAADIVHGFEVEGQGMEEEIAEIQPGATDSLTVMLEGPGTYEIYCPVEDHEQRGMIGTLEVEAANP
ncbi:MAG TPA: cupredoxin domain-containing protein [Gemmatimonadota bacterium]|nr:cupredoxin domain-containing protein [Gemmatimonadota bacterium]